MSRNRLARPLAVFGLGALCGLGQAPFGWWWLTLICLAGLLAAYRGRWLRGGFWLGWAFATGYFAMAMNWIIEPFLVEPERHGWMAPFGLAFMATGLALFWGVAFWGARRVNAPAAGAALAIVAAEYARSVLFTGLPWSLIGHVWVDTPFAPLAAFAGPHGLTLLTALLALALSITFAAPRRVWPLSLVVLGASLAGWFLLNPGPALAPQSTWPMARVVQPNATQAEKWDPEKRAVFFERLVEGTRAGTPPDLIVWPETALQEPLDIAQYSLEAMADAARGAPVIFGVNRREGTRYFNSLVLLDRQGALPVIYDKQHITPFGEYVPFGEIAERFGITGLAASQGYGFSEGTGETMFSLPGFGLVRPLICYEGIFAEEINPDHAPLDAMVLITNDAWFGSRFGPQQHLAQARLRAIEQGAPLIRAANTGISAIIDGKGRILAEIPMHEHGYVEAAVPPAETATPYRLYGDFIFFALFGSALLILWIERTKRA